MTNVISAILIPVRDLEAAKAIYTLAIGSAPTQDAPYYVGYSVNGIDIGLVPNGFDQGMTGPVPYVKVDDLDGRIEALVAAGATVAEPARPVGGGRRVATLRDKDGSPIGLMQDGE